MMKNIYYLFFILLALSFQACQTDMPVEDKRQNEQEAEAPAAETPADEPTTEASGRPVWVKNAAWETVRTDVLTALVTGYRAIDSLEALQEEIDAHNIAYPDNPWHLYVDTVPSIEDAPMCEVWIADKVTNALVTHPTYGGEYHILVERVDVNERRAIWLAEAEYLNGKLYLDYPPPPVVEPPAPPTAEEIHLSHYHYVIDPAQNGKIIFSVNCVDEWVALGYPSMEACHIGRTTAFNYETMGTGYVRIDGYLYIEPEGL